VLENLKHHRWLLLILVGATALRFYGLAGESLWLDEGQTVKWIGGSYAGLTANWTQGQLFLFILKLWSGIAGTSEFALRFLPAVFGIAVVAAIFFFGQAVALVGLFFSQKWGPFVSIWMFMLVSMCIQGTHSLLSGVASMDFGGKRAAASAAGLFDGCQYLAGGVVGWGLGWFLDKFGWNNWTWSIIPFSILGGILMISLWNVIPQGQLKLPFPKKG